MGFIKMGLMPELGSTRLRAQIVGLGNATDMCFTGRWVEAPEALRIGLVSAVVPNDALLDTPSPGRSRSPATRLPPS